MMMLAVSNLQCDYRRTPQQRSFDNTVIFVISVSILSYTTVRRYEKASCGRRCRFTSAVAGAMVRCHAPRTSYGGEPGAHVAAHVVHARRVTEACRVASGSAGGRHGRAVSARRGAAGLSDHARVNRRGPSSSSARPATGAKTEEVRGGAEAFWENVFGGEGAGALCRAEEDGVASGADAARALRALPLPTLSRDDEYFASVNARFVYGQRPDSDIDELNKLFASVGFPQRDPVRLTRALEHSHLIVWVIADEADEARCTRPGQCVGFARATSDKVFNATIWDVVVSPSWQRRGIGRAMVERLVQRLVREDICNVSLYAEPGVVVLYEECGFQVKRPVTCVSERRRQSVPWLQLEPSLVRFTL